MKKPPAWLAKKPPGALERPKAPNTYLRVWIAKPPSNPDIYNKIG
jgi:hypothetical protein